MKLSAYLALLAIMPLFTQVSARIYPRQDGQRNRGGNGGNANDGDNANAGADVAGANDGVNNDGGNDGGDPQTSLALDPRVIADGFATDGQDVPVAGQVPSLTSTNNFINFCLTVPDQPITNGKQITTGSCNPAPIGVIPSTDNMPSSKFTNPKNGDTIPSDEAFTISMAINNLATGNFVNAQENYFAAPQQLNNQGIIIGHSHVIVELLDSLDQSTPTNPNTFAFFKGLNAAAENGVLTADVSSGLPAGAYRLCSINAAANHQPVIVPIAQHGFLDDCVYFTATPGGAVNNDDNDNDGGNDNAGAGEAANGGDNTGAEGAANNGDNTGANGDPNGDDNTGANDGDNTGADGDPNGGGNAGTGGATDVDDNGDAGAANNGNGGAGAVNDDGAVGANGDNTGDAGAATGGDNPGVEEPVNGDNNGATGGADAGAAGDPNTGFNGGRRGGGRRIRNGGRGGRDGRRRGSIFVREH